jgi:hypothetical protein
VRFLPSRHHRKLIQETLLQRCLLLDPTRLAFLATIIRHLHLSLRVFFLLILRQCSTLQIFLPRRLRTLLLHYPLDHTQLIFPITNPRPLILLLQSAALSSKKAAKLLHYRPDPSNIGPFRDKTADTIQTIQVDILQPSLIHLYRRAAALSRCYRLCQLGFPSSLLRQRDKALGTAFLTALHPPCHLHPRRIFHHRRPALLRSHYHK